MHHVVFNLDPISNEDKTKKLYLFRADLAKSSIRLFEETIDDVNQLNWFLENEHHIRNDKLPIENTKHDSIAIVLNQFYDSYNPEENNDQLIDDVYSYRSRHGFRFAFRGHNIKDIYVGYENGYEISCDEDELKFSYTIDINTFFESIFSCIFKCKSL